MKNLRKIFAVVLVVAMALSFGAVASAANLADYADASTVTSKTAVDVMAGAGVMTGDGGSNWNPTGTFTRAQAAKVIADLMSPYAKLTSVVASSFGDVKTTDWSSPYIEYVFNKGVILGYGNGMFGPNDPVTGSQFSVMLLKALGYGKNNEFAGNWEVAAIEMGLSLGILSGTADFSAPATREQVAQYAFNALFVAAVVFDKNTEAYGPTTPASTLASKTGIAKTATTVVNGMTVYNYTKNGVAITGTYAVDTLMGTSSNGTAYASLTTTGNAAFIAADTSAAVYYNGMLTSGVTTPTTANAQAAAATKGVVVSFYNNDTDAAADAVIITEKAIVTLAAAPVVTATTVDIAGVTAGAVALDKVPGYAALAAGDVVAFYMSATDSVYHVEKCMSVTAKLTALTATTFTIGGAQYMVSGLSGAAAAPTTAELNVDKVYYTDPTGYLVKMTATPTAPAANVFYGYAKAYAQAYVVPATLIAPAVPAYEVIQFVDATGATVVKNTVLDAAATSGALTNNGIENTLFAYTLSPDGKIATISAATAITAIGGQVIQGAAFSYTAGSVYYASASTTFFYVDTDGDVAVYTGYANAVTTSTAAAAGSAAFTNKAVLVDLQAGQLPGTPASAASFALVVDNTITTTYDTTTSKYVWTVNALNTAGEATQLKWTDANVGNAPTVAKGLVTFTTTAGFVSGNLANIATVDQEVTQVESTFFVQNGAAVNYTDSTKFFVLTKTGSDFTGIAAAMTIPANTAVNDTTVVYSAGSPVTVVFYVIGAVD